jgi:AcrR family transcriptional regulator
MTLTPKGARTRARIVDGAAEALRENDFEPLTLDELRAATRTSKSQLFHYFPGGKDELLLEVMRGEAQRVIDDQEPELGDLTSWASWERWRSTVVDRYRRQGVRCPLNALVTQLGTTPGARDVSAALLARWGGRLTAGVTAMQAAGGMRADRSPRQIAAALLAGIQGGVVVMWSTGTTEHLEATLDLLFESLRIR